MITKRTTFWPIDKSRLDPQPEYADPLVVKPAWSGKELLRQDGTFYFEDVVGKLNLPSADLKKRAWDLEKDGQSPWLMMGLAKKGKMWIVQMKQFSSYLKKNPFTHIKEVRSDWDGNHLLSQKGLFYLVDVCEKIPFSPHQIRYKARLNKDSARDYGVWKDEKHQTYIVDMVVFSSWIRGVWSNFMGR